MIKLRKCVFAWTKRATIASRKNEKPDSFKCEATISEWKERNKKKTIRWNCDVEWMKTQPTTFLCAKINEFPFFCCLFYSFNVSMCVLRSLSSFNLKSLCFIKHLFNFWSIRHAVNRYHNLRTIRFLFFFTLFSYYYYLCVTFLFSFSFSVDCRWLTLCSTPFFV